MLSYADENKRMSMPFERYWVKIAFDEAVDWIAQKKSIGIGYENCIVD